MRIPNILPMLLMALSLSLAAQNGPCNIYDLTAQVVDCANGQFYAKLNFQHQNTSGDGFSVKGNGVSYGNFSYSQVPVVIGPLPANGTTNYGFVVRDLVYQDCADDVGLGTVTCANSGPCEIYDMAVTIGDCTSSSTYAVTVNFKVHNASSDQFEVVGNGQVLGTYPLSALPLKIDNFPAAANTLGGYIKVCIKGDPNCCSIKQFIAPDCSQPTICEISNVSIETGDCAPGGLYKLKLDFDVTGASNDLFEVWAGNGTYLGNFPINQLPVNLAFPWGGGTVDHIKICINDNPDCCKTVEFPAPACFNPCRIQDLHVETGDCTSDSTFEVWVKFQPAVLAVIDSFDLWAGNGKYLGRFATANMPVHLTDFPWGGGSVDAVKVCVSNSCCREKEFNVPKCLAPPCGINDLKVEVGDCTSPKTYKVVLNFIVPSTTPNNPSKFNVYADNGDFLGTHGLNELPLALNFPWNGDDVDALKVCLLDADGNEVCCKVVEFKAPDCLGISCGIFNLTVKTGDCNDDGSYQVWVDFQTPVASLSKFGIWTGTGKFLGFFSTGNLPVYIPNFPASGNSIDKIVICFSNACCETKEFNAPDCAAPPCGIANLVVDPGGCTSDTTYKLLINFQVTTPAPGVNVPFTVYAGNGQSLGNYMTSDLPLTIQNFPWSGNAVDYIKICIGNSLNTYCCKVVEFKAPDCLNPCGIFNLKVETGPCNDDGTYQVVLNFVTVSSAPAVFGVWAGNGQFIGIYSIADLPLKIPHFPGSGSDMDEIKVCLLTPGSTVPTCCRTLKFKAPDCSSNPCGLHDLTVKTGKCTADSTYEVWIDFKVNSPTLSAQFAVYANGTLFGQYPLGALPLYIPNFPWNGGANDVVKVCLVSPLTVICCETLEFKVPDCLSTGPCEIYDLVVDPGGCTSDSTYKLYLNFKVQNPGQTGQFGVWANGQLLGFYNLSDLPLSIANFPWDGGNVNVVKVCLVTSNSGGSVTCCATKEFQVPSCLFHPCEIYDLKVETGACNNDGTYQVWVNFKFANPPAVSTPFGVWANGQLIGFFPLNQLPLYIPNFPTNGGPNDVIKVCLSNTGAISCCATLEFPVPDCVPSPCDIYDLKVETGNCNADGTYHAWVIFKASNVPANALFGVWANGVFQGSYPLSALPLHIEHFPTDGGPKDVVKVCLIGTTPNIPPACCETLEFPVPACLGGDCKIYDVTVVTGDCHNDGTYTIKIDFKVDNPGNDFFEVWAGSGQNLGYFPLSNLPLIIEHFPWGGGNVDVIKICINDHPDCCKYAEFKAPDCVQGNPCDIYDLKVETGDCNDDHTYNAWVNFKVNNAPAGAVFGVWANGQFLGTYPLSALPLHIDHFPTNGGPNDVVKVCLIGSAANTPLCCETLEFPVPDCVPSGPCQIVNLHVKTGDCNDDGTFHVWIDFQALNTTSAGLNFQVWANNGQLLGTWPLSALPLHIEHFPPGSTYSSVIKVCLVPPNADSPLCCKSVKFPNPNCMDVPHCKIWDLQVQATPCLCGQFFAIVTFKHQFGGSGGFDIAGNGVNYGNYPYNTQQPIILGPLDGDGVTQYEFVVKDHLHPDCHDAVNLGVVDCTQQFQRQAAGGKLVLSPNPTSNWLSVTAQLSTGTVAGQATAEIRQADGRLVRTVVVANGSNFQLDVSELPAGLYRLSLQTAEARLESTFAKQ